MKVKDLNYKISAKKIQKLIQEEDEKWTTNNHKYNKITCGLPVYAGNQSLSDYFTNHERKGWSSPVADYGSRSLAQLRSTLKEQHILDLRFRFEETNHPS